MSTPRYFQILDSLTLALRRFPLVLLAALCATAAAILNNHGWNNASDEYSRLILTLIIGFPLFTASAFFAEIHPRGRWIANGIALFLLPALWYLLPLKMETDLIWYRYWMFFFAATALASLTPGLKTNGSTNWWRMNLSMLNALVMAGIMSGIVIGGLELAWFSMTKLFSLKLEKLPQDLFFFCSLFLFPVCTICLFPPADGEPDAEQPGFIIWRNLCKWALLPLGFLFIGILGVYAIQILIQWKLPNGMVATPVLALGAYGTAAMLLLQPWRDSHSWAKWFSRIYPSAFLLSSILLFISLAERIGHYGITFGRYSALAAGIWLLFSALFFLLRIKTAPVLVFALLALMTFIAALGPLSAGTLSLHSQSARLAKYLHADKKQKNTEDILSILNFLARNYGVEAVECVTGPLNLDKKIARWEVAQKIMEKLGIKENRSEIIHFNWPEGKALLTGGARSVFLQAQWGNNQILLGKNDKNEEVKILLAGNQLTGYVDSKEVVTMDLKSFVVPDSGKSEDFPSIPIQLGGREFLVVIQDGILEKDSSGKQTLRSVGRFLILEK